MKGPGRSYVKVRGMRRGAARSRPPGHAGTPPTMDWTNTPVKAPNTLSSDLYGGLLMFFGRAEALSWDLALNLLCYYGMP